MDHHALKTILWREWLVNRHLILNCLGLWITVTLILPVFWRTTPMIVACILLGQVLAVRLGGSDSATDSEIFGLALPPRRMHFFWARYGFGVAVLSVFLAAGLVAIRDNLSAAIWGMFVESGLTRGKMHPDLFDSFPRAAALVFGSYSATFCLAANHAGRAVVISIWCIGLSLWLLLSHSVGHLLYRINDGTVFDARVQPFDWHRYAGSIALVSCAIGVGALVAGATHFRRRAAGSPLGSRIATALIIIIGISAGVIGIFLPSVIGVWDSSQSGYIVPRF